MASQAPTPLSPRAQRRAARDQVRLQRLQLRALRPSSMLGPLLLISIGVIALIIELGHLNAPRSFYLLARWWPLLLVGAGVVRLLEWLADQRRRRNAIALGQPYAPRALGGGVVLLLVVLIAAGILSSLATRNHGQVFGQDFSFNPDDWDQFVGDKHESDLTLQHACPAGTVLTVDSPHGDITIAGTSTDGLMHLVAHTTVFTRSDADAQRRVSETTPQVQSEGDQLGVRIPAADGTHVDLTISLPPATAIVVHGNQGDVSVRAQQAPVTIIANHGDVEANDITGALTVHVNKGDSSFSAHNDRGSLTLEGRAMDVTLSDLSGAVTLTGEFFGTVHLERSAGPVRFHTGRVDLAVGRIDGNLELNESSDLSADGLVGPVLINTRNRNIDLERVSGEVSITNRNGAVTLSAAPPLANITIENRTGEVKVTLPSNAGFSLDASTHDADLTNEFGLTPVESNDATHLTGTVGAGGPMIRLETTKADLSIQRGNLSPLPSQPPTPPAAPLPSSQPTKHHDRPPKSPASPDVTF